MGRRHDFTPVRGLDRGWRRALAALVLAGVAVAGAARSSEVAPHGRRMLAAAAEPPSLHRIASAVADALHETGRLPVGAAAVSVEVEPDGEYRCLLRGASEEETLLFASALGEATGPLVRPRYVVPRWVVIGAPTWWRSMLAAYGRVSADGEVWHPVPTVLGAHADLAAAYSRAWEHWVGGGAAVWTGSPEGAGVLAAQQGSDPFDVVTVMRRQWT
jgi:hypothetical protein